ncbi:MAG: hypothetical protein H6718_19810 [Polyangiaceae bacterium]|nr:hypothetical protein [Myxococcales bacterium]MCB9587659.1 hypothetical protein [Polyangiaceae bacterium]MCB9605543.1 hypothetical protein [Polyangiaceae bacterium]
MAEDEWNDELRNELLESVCGYMLGEVRLGKRDDEEIVFIAVDRLADEIPEEEVPLFEAHAIKQLPLVRQRHEAEQSDWPEETDCDRLDEVQDELQEDGIVFWQASPCCNTCSQSELPDRLREIDEDDPGFAKECRGYAFFHDQSLPDELLENSQLLVYLSYGWFPDKDDVSETEYAKQALAIGEEVCDALESAGFRVDWTGDLSKKIGLHINWQRRTQLS